MTTQMQTENKEEFVLEFAESITVSYYFTLFNGASFNFQNTGNHEVSQYADNDAYESRIKAAPT